MLSWETQAHQYAPKGKPGISLEEHSIRVGNTMAVIDCLLCRDPGGNLIGILNHYHEGNPWQKAGSVNIWVEPHHRHQGIASVLLRDAWHRWDLKYEDQEWTGDGAAWLKGLEDKGKINIKNEQSLNEELDWRNEPTKLAKWWETS